MTAHAVGLLVFLSLIKTFPCVDYFTLDTTDHDKKTEGSCVDIKCKVNRFRDTLGATWYWIKDPKGSDPHNDGIIVYSNDASKWSEDYKGRVELITSPPSTQSICRIRSCVQHCSIRICELKKSDSGKYMFRYVRNDFKWSIPKTFLLEVVENPCPITFEELPTAQENQTITLKCSTLTSCPSNLQIDPPLQLSSNISPSLTSKITTQTFKATWQDNGAEFSCQQQNNHDVYLRRKIKLTVEYAPRDVVAEASLSMVKEGKSVTLTCSGKGQPAPEFTWFKGNQLQYSRAKWRITSITEAQNGSYTCRAKNELGEKLSIVTIDVTYAPQVEVEISQEHHGSLEEVREGVRVTFNCNVKRSFPSPHSFTWFKDSSCLKSSNINWRQKSVAFTVKANDRGVYKCKATNSVGNGESRERYFQVMYKPRNTWISQDNINDFRVKVNRRFRMTCKTEAYPTPWFSWYRYQQSDGSKLTHMISQNESLTLEKVQRADEACYICNASNSVDAGDVSEPFCIQVLFPPTGVVFSMEAEVTEGQVVTITCSTESSPPSTLTLSRSSESSLTKTTLFPRLEDKNVIQHTFTATSTDGADYTCDARNSEGSAQSASRKLVVKYAPKEVKIQAWNNVAVKENSSFRLDCTARSHPVVTSTTWTKVTSGGSEPVHSTGSLIFVKSASPTDSGVYTCKATNEMGSGTSESIEIKVHYGPKHTRIIEGQQHRLPDGTSVVPLSCFAHCYPPAKQYSWYKKADNESGDMKISDSQNITVSSHEPGEYYCMAENEISGRPSEVVPLFAGNVRQILTFSIIFCLILVISFLAFFLFRHSRNKLVQHRPQNRWSGCDFVAYWNGSRRMNEMNEASLTGPSRSRDDLLTHQTRPDRRPASTTNCVYSTVNLPKGEPAPSAHGPWRQNGARQEEESLHYVSLHFENKNRKPEQDAVFAAVSKVKPTKAEERKHETFEDYENTTQAGKASHPSVHDRDTSEGDVEVTYSNVYFKTNVRHQRPQTDSSSSEEDTLYSELKV